MNELIVKRAAIFSVILGALIAFISLIPNFIGLGLFVLALLSAPLVIFYMKRNEKHLSFINNQQGALLGAIIGFFASIGFFIIFCPMVCVIHLIFKKYYSYAIPYAVHSGLWLLITIIFIVALVFAMTNSTSAMGITWFFNQIEKKPENYDAQLDIKIDD